MVGFMCLTFEARRPTFDPELTGLVEGQSPLDSRNVGLGRNDQTRG